MGGVSKVFVDLRTPRDGETRWWRDSAACGSAPVEMVDEAYQRSGGAVAKAFRKQFCEPCPVREECLAEAMQTGEYGVWGGESQHARTKHGAPKPYVGHKKL